MDKCSDCGGELEEGCLIDHMYGGLLVQRYAKSSNIPSSPSSPTLKKFEADFHDVRRVLARRCTKCNKVSLYAQDSIDTPNLNKKYNSMIWIVIGIFLVIIVIGFIASLNGY